MLPDLTTAQFVLLAVLGIGVGTLGTMVGVGGGFLLVPVLLFLFPDAEPAVIVSMSLTSVVLTGASATVGYRRQRLQDFRTGAIFIATALPASVLGALLTRVISRGAFDLVFGAVLIGGALYIAWHGLRMPAAPEPSQRGRERRIVDRSGRVHGYRVNEPLAASLAPAAGFIASFFGIGGGIAYVPVMMLALRIPSAVAVATAQLDLMAVSAAALVVHAAFTLDQPELWLRALIVGGGAAAGAQFGVRLAGLVGGRFVLRVIAAGLLLAGVRQLVSALT